MPRLNVSFDHLLAAVRSMGAENVAVDFNLTFEAIPLDPIDIQLGEGVEVELSEVETESGLLSYEGRQVLLYIQDHGAGVTEALEDSSKGRKFHVADCSTLQTMRSEGRFERYVATNDLSGEFYVTGTSWPNGQSVEGHTRLDVCRNCLSGLNYEGYRYNRREVFARFSLEKFFSAYSSFFRYMPRRMAGEFGGGYTTDWPEVAARYKKARGFQCEKCEVVLNTGVRLLHVHHIDGVKTNNRQSNLKALCADCHRKEPRHDHMFVSHEDAQRVTALRREQGRANAAEWQGAFELADPAVHGVLHYLQRAYSVGVPEVGYEVGDNRGVVVAELELAWPHRQLGIAIAERDRTAAEAAGWQAISVREALERGW